MNCAAPGIQKFKQENAFSLSIILLGHESMICHKLKQEKKPLLRHFFIGPHMKHPKCYG